MATSGAKYALEGTKIGLQFLQDVAEGLPFPVKVAVNVVQRILGLVEAIKTNKEECKILKDRILQVTLVVAIDVKNGTHDQEGARLETIPPSLIKKLEDFQMRLLGIEQTLTKIQKRTELKGIGAFFKALTLSGYTAEALKRCNQDLEWEMKLFDVNSRIDEVIRVAQLSEDVAAVHQDVRSTRGEVRGARAEVRAAENLARLEALPRAKNASYRAAESAAPGGCFQGTRMEVLDEIHQWVKDTNPAAGRTLWLSGMAGMGKSAISYSVSERADKDGILGGNFFFSKFGDSNLQNSAICLPTLAYQLAMFAEDLKSAIADGLSKNPDVAYSKLPDQLAGLLINPTQQLNRSPGRVVLIVLDGLDECDDRGAEELIHLLLSHIDCFPFTLKLLIASRPEPHLVSAFSTAPTVHRIALHRLDTSSAEKDILHYLRHELTNLPETLHMHSLSSTWISEEEIKTLAAMAGQLFVYASIVVRFIGDNKLRDPRYQLETIIKAGRTFELETNPYGDLDALYTHILKNALPSDCPPKFISRFRSVVGAILVLKESSERCDLDTLEKLLRIQTGEAREALYHLSSVIVTEPYPEVFHKSFSDFLHIPSRCSDPRFHISIGDQAGLMALRCLTLMTSSLRRGMIQVPDGTVCPRDWSDSPEGQKSLRHAFLPELRYSCYAWLYYVIATKGQNQAVIDALDAFTASSLLWWMEALNWLLNRPFWPHDILLDKVGSREWPGIFEQSLPASSKSILQSAMDVLLINQQSLYWDPRLVYRAPIPIYSRNTEFFETYRDQFDRRVLSPKMWRRYENSVTYAIRFSPDGTHLAAMIGRNNGNYLVIRDLLRCTCVEIAIVPDDQFWTISFSPDGTMVVAHNASGELHMLDLSREEEIVFAINTDSCFKGNQQEPQVLFSIDGNHVATMRGGGVSLWDAKTGDPIAKLQSDSPFDFDPDYIKFSPDGKSIAALFLETHSATIVMWNLITLTTSSTLQCDRVEGRLCGSIQFSPDATLLAYHDAEIAQIWDVPSQTVISSINLGDICLGVDVSRDLLVGNIYFSNDRTMVMFKTATRIALFESRTGRRVVNPGSGVHGLFPPDASPYLVSGSHTSRLLLSVDPSWESVSQVGIIPYGVNGGNINCFATHGNRVAFGGPYGMVNDSFVIIEVAE